MRRSKDYLPNRSTGDVGFVVLRDGRPMPVFWRMRLTQLIGGRNWSLSIVRRDPAGPVRAPREHAPVNDHYCAQRDAQGNIRLDCGRGFLLAGPDATMESLAAARDGSSTDWQRAEYESALRLLAEEAHEVADLKRRLGVRGSFTRLAARASAASVVLLLAGCSWMASGPA